LAKFEEKNIAVLSYPRKNHQFFLHLVGKLSPLKVKWSVLRIELYLFYDFVEDKNAVCLHQGVFFTDTHFLHAKSCLM
jgi:hypothetical protein